MILAGALCFAPFFNYARAEGTFREAEGDDWSMSSDGVLTLESNAGWTDYLKHGAGEIINKLVIGKRMTNFYLFDLDYEEIDKEFVFEPEFYGYDEDGAPYYGEHEYCPWLQPQKIEVEDGNKTFSVTNGLLINNKTHALVLSEVGLTDVIIPEGVEIITTWAFLRRDVAHIQFPSTLKSIGLASFCLCADLVSVEFPDSLIEMKTGAFSLCRNLASVTFAGGLRSIGEEAFDGCDSLKSINFADGLTEIKDHAFRDCTSLRKVVFPDSLEVVGADIFSGCLLNLIQLPPKLSMEDPTEILEFGTTRISTAIFSGNQYTTGIPAIKGMRKAYFLGAPPETLMDYIDEDYTENVYYLDEFAEDWAMVDKPQWTLWKLEMVTRDQAEEMIYKELNPPEAVKVTPKFLPTPTSTPYRAPTPSPLPEPSNEVRTGIDPVMIVLPALIVLTIAAVVVIVARRRRK